MDKQCLSTYVQMRRVSEVNSAPEQRPVLRAAFPMLRFKYTDGTGGPFLMSVTVKVLEHKIFLLQSRIRLISIAAFVQARIKLRSPTTRVVHLCSGADEVI